LATEAFAARVVVLENITCPYCAADLGPANSDRDHLIGRRFVPRGSLDRSWNLILQACKVCNNRKSDLEDDISAITMQPDAAGRFARDDERLVVDAQRKSAKSISRLSGKTVLASSETVSIKTDLMPGVKSEFTFEGPPQLGHERAMELARFHLSGLFYWLTFQESESKGYYWLGDGFLLQVSTREDWGNDEAVGFMNLVSKWQCRLVVSAADGFFKAAFRRHPDDKTCWSWALEWNERVRTVGFLGDSAVVHEIAMSLPKLRRQSLETSDGRKFRFRTESALSPDLDCLFL
jgi:hypothetical protein